MILRLFRFQTISVYIEVNVVHVQYRSSQTGFQAIDERSGGFLWEGNLISFVWNLIDHKMGFPEDDIAKIIQNLGRQKPQSYDHISILMLKICGDTICIPLAQIIQCLDEVNVVHVQYRSSQTGFQAIDERSGGCLWEDNLISHCLEYN